MATITTIAVRFTWADVAVNRTYRAVILASQLASRFAQWQTTPVPGISAQA